MADLTGKRALVTGGAGGIAQAIAAGLQAHGAIVTGADRHQSAADFDCIGDLMAAAVCDGLPE